MKKKNEEILESMKDAKTEDEKLHIWDAYVAQKMIDEAPMNTLKVRLSDYFKTVCKNWHENREIG